MTQVTFYGKTADEAAAEYLAKRNNELDALRNIMASKAMDNCKMAIKSQHPQDKEPSAQECLDLARYEILKAGVATPATISLSACSIPNLWVASGAHVSVYSDDELEDMENEAVAEERTRILAHLDSMEPGRLPYTRASAEFERKIARRLWERIRAAVESGEEAPKSDDVHLAVNRASGASAAPTVTAAPQTPSGLTTIAAIGAKKWGA